MMSRASLVRCSCPWRVKLIFPQTHLPCLTSIWVMSTAVSGNQRPTGCGPGPAKRSPRIVRGSPPAMSIAPPAMSIALRQSQMDIFDFILIFSWQKPSELVHKTDSTASRGSGTTPPVAVSLSLALDDSRSVLSPSRVRCAASRPGPLRADLKGKLFTRERGDTDQPVILYLI